MCAERLDSEERMVKNYNLAMKELCGDAVGERLGDRRQAQSLDDALETDAGVKKGGPAWARMYEDVPHTSTKVEGVREVVQDDEYEPVD